MNPNASIEKHAEEVLRQFGPRTQTICDEVKAYHQIHTGSVCPESEEFLEKLIGLCGICEETNTALTEHVLVDFDPTNHRTESTIDHRPMSIGIQKIIRWVNDHPSIFVGASILAIGTLFVVISKR